MPTSRTGTSAVSISTPLPARPAISVADEVRPAAPMSWMPVMWPLAMSSSDASRRSFSVKGSPTCTMGRLDSSASSLSSSEAKVAPWIPSRPVRAPTAINGLPTPSATPVMRSSCFMRPRHMALTRGLPS